MMIRRTVSAVFDYLRTPPGEIPPNVSQAIHDEIEAHLALSMLDRTGQGLNSDEACRRAFNDFGNITTTVHDCSDVWFADQNVCHRVHLALTAVLLIGMTYWIAIGRTERKQPGPITTGDLHGRVMDEQSRPLRQAHILAVVKTWPPHGYRQQAYMTATGQDGSFRIDDVYPTDESYEVQVAVVADDRLLQSTYVSDGSGELEPFAFTLKPSEPIVLRFRWANGAPVEGVEVFPHRRVDSTGRDDLVYFDSADPVVRRSNAEGLAELPYFAPGDQATVYYRAPGNGWQTRDLVIPQDTQLVVLDLDTPNSNPSDTSERRGT